MSLNKVMLIGNVGVDPEYRTTATGTAVVSLTLATNEKWTDKQGAKQEKTEWHRVAMFNKLAELANQYVKKGSKIYIEGKITTSTYEKNGETQYKTEVIVSNFELIAPREDATMPPSKPQSESAPDFAEDIPF